MQQAWTPEPAAYRTRPGPPPPAASVVLPRSVSAGYLPEYYNGAGAGSARKPTPVGQHYHQYSLGWGAPQQPMAPAPGAGPSRYHHKSRLSQSRATSATAPERYHRRRSTTGVPMSASGSLSASSTPSDVSPVSSAQSVVRANSPAHSLPDDGLVHQGPVRRTPFADRNSAYELSTASLSSPSSMGTMPAPLLHRSSGSAASDDSTRADSLRSAAGGGGAASSSSISSSSSSSHHHHHHHHHQNRPALVLPSDRRRASDPQLRVPSAPATPPAGILKPPKEPRDFGTGSTGSIGPSASTSSLSSRHSRIGSGSMSSSSASRPRLDPISTSQPATATSTRQTDLPPAVSASQRQPPAPAPLGYPAQPASASVSASAPPPHASAPLGARQGSSASPSPSPSPSTPNFSSPSPLHRPGTPGFSSQRNLAYADGPDAQQARQHQYNSYSGRTSSRTPEPTAPQQQQQQHRQLPPSSSSKSLGARLKKAFTFGSSSSSASSRSSTTSSSAASIKTSADDDARSLFSMRSTTSTASFETFRRLGRGTRSIFRRKRDADDSSVTSPTATTGSAGAGAGAGAPPPSPGTPLDIAAVTPAADRKLAAPAATLVITHAVAEAETRPYESEAIPSLTSESSSAGDSEETQQDQDSLAAGDTVFPKNLDRLSVETIKSSIERKKSLERRHSKRSAKNGTAAGAAKQTDDDKADQLPAKTEVYVHTPPAADVQRSSSVSSTGTPKSILKSSPRPGADGSTNDDNDSSSITGEGDFSVKRGVPAVDGASDSAAALGSLLDINFGDSSDFSIDFDQFGVDKSEATKPELEAAPVDLSATTTTTATTTSNPSTVPRTTPSTPLLGQQLDSAPQLMEPQLGPSAPVGVPAKSEYPPPDGSAAMSSRSDDSQATARASVPLRYNHSRTPSSSGSSSAVGFAPSPNPGTSTTASRSPRRSVANTVTFSSRIVIYDTWGRGDYDRRPDLATCNRLTPLLAQQIKEELNSFKMEMEIHTESKAFTHFF